MLFQKKEYDTEDKDQKKKLNLVLIGVAVIAVLVVVRQSIVVIPTGYTGVKSVFGQISGDYVPNAAFRGSGVVRNVGYDGDLL